MDIFNDLFDYAEYLEANKEDAQNEDTNYDPFNDATPPIIREEEGDE